MQPSRQHGRSEVVSFDPIATTTLEGVVGVGLVGVTAPWAERIEVAEKFGFGEIDFLPLGPLEPLREVAERARLDCPQPCPYGANCEVCAGRPITSLCFVIAAAPDDGVCAECGGSGEIVISDSVDGFWNCVACSGTGKALSSADVARELSGDTCVRLDVWQVTHGGVTISHYPTRAALAEHGLRAVIERLTR